MILVDARAVTTKPCGVSRVAQSLVSHLDSLDESRDKFTILVNKGYESLVPTGVMVIVVPAKFGRLSIVDNLYLFFLLSRLKPRVFYSLHSWMPLFLPSGIEKRGFLLHDLFAIQSMEHFKGSLVKKYLSNLFFRFITWVSIKNATFVVVPSKTIQKDLKLFYGDIKIRVHQIYHGLEHLLEGAASDETQGESQLEREGVLFVGNFRHYKGVDIFLASMSALQSEGYKIKATIVTNESSGRIADLQESAGLNNLTIIPAPSDAELREVRASHLIAVIPSREEGFGLPVAEALFAGLVPVYSDIEVFMELYGVHKLGQTFRSCESDHLTRVLKSTWSELNEGEAHDTELEGLRAQLIARYSWSHAARQIWALFQ